MARGQVRVWMMRAGADLHFDMTIIYYQLPSVLLSSVL